MRKITRTQFSSLVKALESHLEHLSDADLEVAVIQAASEYKYKAVTHGTFTYSARNEFGDHVDTQADPEDMPDEQELQDAIDKDWEGFDPELGLGEYLDKDELKKAGLMDKVRKLLKMEGRPIKVKIPAPQADIQSELDFTLTWELAADAKLSSEQQKMIQLFYFKGMTHETISTMCDIPLGTVKSRIRLALSKLKKTLHGVQERGAIDDEY